MAMVTYECLNCGNYWHEGSGRECPKCKSKAVVSERDE